MKGTMMAPCEYSYVRDLGAVPSTGSVTGEKSYWSGEERVDQEITQIQ